MKKFGTPIGAGPGSESEKLGLDADGTPLPVGRTTFFFLALDLACPVGVDPEVVVVCGWLEGFCFLVGRLGTGLGRVLDDEVEVELEVELEDDELELELVELLELGPVACELVLELVVVLDELELSGTQLSDTTVAPGGSAGIVPAGTLDKTIGGRG